ncbi:GNAT family N-acetyltransferase [Anaerotignum lactatifermentans]|uniref:GNAT family N-acetyltransferase n=1 Tax=Anaerotignum lactatifermentans TaxID=160404 RepID=A0ABS2G9E8_9FIRM|nr:N-acetyltransferase [Anaerotignum lactatifermentans]MBM6829258.1 GNAT family N-acetyltransferase [Anaerotignum lactatifermentans]MBM6877502.1 GNAT family N-acetyltransferase [Anaerotignum lactatifermentans]MBM6950836.1 GNAT family N-acetyltransferase [Anaerotignum lactatifermentans]
MDCIIRALNKEEDCLLPDFLYHAIFLPEGAEPPPRSVVDLPELQVYITGFGRPHDYALAAEHDGQVVGLVWARIMEDYGHVDQHTPSLAISLLPEFRGRGIGTALMNEMLSLLQKKGYEQVSLSVQKTNPAVRLYGRLGFQTQKETEEEYLMVHPLSHLYEKTLPVNANSP